MRTSPSAPGGAERASWLRPAWSTPRIRAAASRTREALRVQATGAYLPLACTLNASRVLDAAARILGVDHAGLSQLALSAPPGADGLVLIPYLEGERTPNKPDATGAIHGMRLANTTPAHLARAAVEGLLCAMADGLDALRAMGVPVERIQLIGGGAQSEAVRAIAPAVLGFDVMVPEPGEYVADGAARQAAWVLSAANGGDRTVPPTWSTSPTQTYRAPTAPASSPSPGTRADPGTPDDEGPGSARVPG